MKVSRREFVNTAGFAAASSLCALPSFGFANNVATPRAKRTCTIIDLESNCALPESFDGMRVALGDSHQRLPESEFTSGFPLGALAIGDVCNVLIVAAAGSVRPETYATVARFLEHGATVLWESGAAFVDPREFLQQQDLAREHFGISIERPLDVWLQSSRHQSASGGVNRSDRNTRAIGHQQVPYIAYRWPCEAHVRDFSRIIPVSATNGRAIAHWEEIPVSLSKRVGSGTLVFLGSPIGPALRAGDSEAHSLLHLIVAA